MRQSHCPHDVVSSQGGRWSSNGDLRRCNLQRGRGGHPGDLLVSCFGHKRRVSQRESVTRCRGEAPRFLGRLSTRSLLPCTRSHSLVMRWLTSCPRHAAWAGGMPSPQAPPSAQSSASCRIRSTVSPIPLRSSGFCFRKRSISDVFLIAASNRGFEPETYAPMRIRSSED